MNLPQTMKAVLWNGSATLEAVDVPMPEVPQGWALIKTEYTGLCGTDFSILHGTHPRAAAPLIMGHEITGTVAVAGNGGPMAGTRVTVEPLIHCGHCHPCQHGNQHVCGDLKLYGIDKPGSLAEFVALPPEVLVPVSGTVPVTEVALAEPLAVAIHAVSRSGLQGGENVVVLGAGPIGLLTALVARQAGAASVLVVEPSVERSDLAKSLGFETVAAQADPVEVAMAATGGHGYDIVFDAAGHPSVAAIVTKVVRVRGTVVIVGVYKKPTELDLQALNFLELTMVGTRVYTRADVEAAVAMIEADSLGLGRLPVRSFALEEANQAFELAMSAGAVVKVFISPLTEPRAAAAKETN